MMITEQEIRTLSKKNARRSAFKTILYLMLLCSAITFSVITTNDFVYFLSVVILGIVIAHGVELQHECLHHNLYRSIKVNRFFGIIYGLPMLVSYTHYQAQHLHHHTFLGTDKDEEIIDYKSEQLKTISGLFTRITNANRFFQFMVTMINTTQGVYPEVIKSKRQQRKFRHEYYFIFFFILILIFLYQVWGVNILFTWFFAWFFISEPLHFFIEVTEHIGKDKSNRVISENTRSYKTNLIWSYISNHNNYHIEHHSYPNVCAHNLKIVNEKKSGEYYTENSYIEAMKNVISGIRNEKSAEDKVIAKVAKQD
ncbi:fatty acid desaturase [Rouxiella badensis]|uniref:fatty acid desaturase family protein n=1 Tax=Rouxiella badensis TaxID=1646377 RepID=UPI001D14DE69|nr:fatty acid desaturase [Rouxiella badensis]MCC3738967.1 fatty acid desaturase [Rouxiella badensis]